MWDFLQAMAPAAALPCLNCSPMHHPITRNQPNRTRGTADKLPLISSPADPRAVSSPPADNGMGCPAVHLLMICLSHTCSTASRASCACCICCAAAACASGPAVTDATSSSACSCSTRVSRAVTCSNMKFTLKIITLLAGLRCLMTRPAVYSRRYVPTHGRLCATYSA